MPRAASLAATIKAETGQESELIPGSGGVFDVTVNGALIFSKHQEGRFPTEGEIVESLKGE